MLVDEIHWRDISEYFRLKHVILSVTIPKMEVRKTPQE